MSRDGGFLEFKQRVLYSLFRAAAQVGLRLNMQIDQMVSLFQMAYFQEAREGREMELGEIADLFGKSLRTVSSLHQRYRSDFFAPEREVQFRRDIAEVLQEKPVSREDLAAAFPSRTPEDVAAAVDDLLREKRILEDGTLLRRNPEHHDFFDEADIVRRVDGLNRQMDIVASTVFTRLLDGDANAAAARTYVFAARDEDFHALVDDMLEMLRERAIAADAAAQDAGVRTRHGFTFAAGPLEEP